jgi:thioredoxin
MASAHHGRIKEIQGLADFSQSLDDAGTKLVVVDFFATWCGPCKTIAPFFSQLSERYQTAVFLKVDVDKCSDVASQVGVTAMPTFHLYRSRNLLDQLKGAVQRELEQLIIKHLGNSSGEEDARPGPDGTMDLSSILNKTHSECLNASEAHPLAQCLEKGSGFLESDTDAQLIISLPFNQAVRVNALRIEAPSDGRGPRSLRLFINQPNTPDFDACEALTSVQDLVLKPDDLAGKPIALKLAKFTNILNLVIYVRDNQGGAETTVIGRLSLIGSSMTTTNMNDFKRVTGQKGETE